MGDYETALDSLNKCKEMSRHIDNLRLNLDSLICISNIRYKMKNKESKQEAEDLFKEALSYAEQLDDDKYSLNCVASLGILEGERQFEAFLHQVNAGHIGNIKPKQAQQINVRKSTQVIKEEIGFQET